MTQWLRRGHLCGFKIGKEWRVSERDLQAFLAQSANIPTVADRISGEVP